MSRLFAALAAALLLAACEGGDIVIQPSTTDASVDNSTNNSNNTNTTSTSEDNPCAVYEQDGSTFEGQQVGANCVYSPSFADAGNNLTVNLRIPALADGGAHIFEGSLFVGRTHDTDEGLANAGITRGGDGPALTVEAGATIAFQSSADFLIINRGSQLFAVGTREAPITFTSVSDIEGSAGPEDVQQWGGMVINGFGVTNKCDYEGSAGSLTTSDCHVDAEGAAGLDESQYGGDNNEDSSGRLEYVVVKHTGATVGNGDELNGISFGGVGSNTIVKNLEVYSTFDDGIEMFGGAVSFENFVGLYVRDDAIDIDEGWSGTDHQCLGDSVRHGWQPLHRSRWHRLLRSSLTEDEVEATVRSGHQQPPDHQQSSPASSPPNGVDTATHDPGAGWRLAGRFVPDHQQLHGDRFLRAEDASPDSSTANYCLRIDNRSLQAAQDGDLAHQLGASLPAPTRPRATRCRTAPASKPGLRQTANGSVFADVSRFRADATANADTDLQLLEGTPPIYSIDYATDGR